MKIRWLLLVTNLSVRSSPGTIVTPTTLSPQWSGYHSSYKLLACGPPLGSPTSKTCSVPPSALRTSLISFRACSWPSNFTQMSSGVLAGTLTPIRHPGPPISRCPNVPIATRNSEHPTLAFSQDRITVIPGRKLLWWLLAESMAYRQVVILLMRCGVEVSNPISISGTIHHSRFTVLMPFDVHDETQTQLHQSSIRR